MFHTCLRRYYYRYYAGEKGRHPGASPRELETYFLCDLQLRQTWAQQHLERAALNLLHEQKPSPDSDPAPAVARLLEALRGDFRASRRGGYRQIPKLTGGLFEHEYGIQVPDQQWKALAEDTAARLEAFLGSDYAQELARVTRADRLAVGETLGYEWQGLPIRIVATWADRAGDLVRVHGWYGQTDDAEIRTLTSAALAGLAATKWSASPGHIVVTEFGFPSGPVHEIRPDADTLAAWTDLLLEAADEMRFPLTDPERNVAREEDFDVAEDDRVCHTCPFLKVCAKWSC